MAAERVWRLLHFIRTFGVTLAAGALLGACVGTTNPVTGETDWTLVDEQRELELGRKAHQALLEEYGYYDDLDLQEYVTRVGQALAAVSHRPELEYRFTVLDSDVVNAFATPGYVYITRGLLARMDSEAELAGVLGHELGHITARHAARQIGQQQTVGLIQLVLGTVTDSRLLHQAGDLVGTAHVRGYGRENELEADRLGAEYAARAGYDPEEFLDVFRALKDEEAYEVRRAAREGRSVRTHHGLFATHPDNDLRRREVTREAGKHPVAGGGQVRREDFLQRIDGMVFGPSEAQGLVRDDRFYHGALNFTMALPKDWPVRNSTQLAATAPDGHARLRLLMLGRHAGQQACAFIREHFKHRTRLRERTTDGYAGCRASVAGEGRAWMDITVLKHASGSFLIAVAEPLQAGGLKRHARTVEKSIQSLRPLRPEEHRAARAARLDIVTAGAGDTYAGYARGATWDEHPEDVMRLINGGWPSGEPTAGEPVKTVR